MAINKEEVIGKVQRAIAHDPRLDSPRITITMLDDTIALAGVVDNPDQVRRAEKLVKEAAPGLKLDNGLTISTNGGATGSDKRLGTATSEALARAVAALKHRPADVSVEVENGVAHLRGTCSTVKDRKFLISAVARVSGVREVQADDFNVGTFGTADDLRLANLAAEKLQHEDLGLYGPVNVHVNHRSARLIGAVRNEYQRARAEDLVSEVPGLMHVHNELELTQAAGRSDGEYALEQEAIHALAGAGLPAPNMHVFVAGGRMVLDGEVETIDQKRKAADIARRLSGVLDVDNRLTVVSRRGRPPLPESKLQQE